MAHSKKTLLILSLLLLAAIVFALPMGRYPLALGDLCRSLLDAWAGRPLNEEQSRQLFLFFDLRLPRIGAALVVGACLSASGTVYQNMFQNPLVSPGILGVQHGAAFGAAIGIVFFSSWPLTQAFSFAGGTLGVGLSLFFAWLYPRARFLALVVGGLVSSSFFVALTSLVQYVADPNRQLPELVYWLMGTLSRTEPRQLAWSLPPMLAGVINWVGLVIPHVMRFIIGPDNRVGLAASALGGALFVLLTDTLIRSVWTVELPLGIATSLISMPLFAFSLWYDWKRR